MKSAELQAIRAIQYAQMEIGGGKEERFPWKVLLVSQLFLGWVQGATSWTDGPLIISWELWSF